MKVLDKLKEIEQNFHETEWREGFYLTGKDIEWMINTIKQLQKDIKTYKDIVESCNCDHYEQ